MIWRGCGWFGSEFFDLVLTVGCFDFCDLGWPWVAMNFLIWFWPGVLICGVVLAVVVILTERKK